MKPTINIQENVNPHFKEVWLSKKPYNILRGGRNSFKSSVVALKLVYRMAMIIGQGKKCNIVVIRKVANTIRDSVFLKIQWALGKFGLLEQFDITVAPFKIKHRATGSSFVFYGADDFQKLKSNDIGDITDVFYEEASEFKNAEEFDQINVTFMRQKSPLVDTVQFYWTYNPPRNVFHWINSWSDEMESSQNHLVHRSSYLNDELGFVTEQMIEEIERIKEADYDYYRYIYLGEAVGLGTEVYNMNLFQEIDQLPADDRLLYMDISIDTGYSISATAVGAYGITAKGNVILLDTYYYDPSKQAVKKAPSEFSKEIKEFKDRVEKDFGIATDRMTIDSADAATRAQMFLDYGIRLNPIAKKKKVNMIENVTSLLVQKRFFILKRPNNNLFIEEHRGYLWDEKTLHSDNPGVIKVADHHCDQFIYFVNDNLRKLGLKF